MYSSLSSLKWSGLALITLLHGCALLTPGPTEPETPTTGGDSTVYPPPVTTPDTSYPPIVDNQMGTPLYHTVRAGETLYGVSQLYGQSWQQIAQWNNIQPPYNLSVGQQLLVSMSGSGSSAGAGTPTTTYPVPGPNPSTPSIIDTQPSGGDAWPPVSSMPPPAVIETEMGYYTVQPGDTLYSIARRYGYSVAQIASWNGLPPPYTLSVGQALLVSPPTGTDIATTPPPVVPRTPTTTTGGSLHTVQAGDTLYNIAQRYGQNVSQIAAWNGLAPPYTLSVGQTLTVSPSGNAAATAPPSAGGSSTHVVMAGDTLYSIARRYGYSVNQIAGWNHLAPPYALSVGQRLQVAPGGGYTTASFSSGSSLRQHSMSSATPINPRSSISFHTVQNNETLASIARQYGLTTHELSIWNGIGMPYTVYPGQKLLIVPP